MKREEMISILVPSRGSPKNVERLYKSLEEGTTGRWELLVRIDADDETMGDYRLIGAWEHLLLVIDQPREDSYKDLIPYAMGSILIHAEDDAVFFPGWDTNVRAMLSAGIHNIATIKWVEGA